MIRKPDEKQKNEGKGYSCDQKEKKTTIPHPPMKKASLPIKRGERLGKGGKT